MQAVHMDPNGQIWLTRSAKEGDCAGIQACLECGVAVDELNRNHETALMCACEAGQADCVKLLLTSGAQTHFVSQTGTSAILKCVTDSDGVERSNQRECLRLLLRAGERSLKSLGLVCLVNALISVHVCISAFRSEPE